MELRSARGGADDGRYDSESSGRQCLSALKESENTQWEVSTNLANLGVRPGDAVAVLGHSTLGDYWAHLAQVRIVADIPVEGVPVYWESNAETKSRIMNALASTGAVLLVTRFEPPNAELQDWQHVGATGYYALPLRAKAVQKQVFALRR